MADLHHQPEPEGPGRREHGIRRVSTATRWTIGAAAAGSAALGLTYVSLAPGASGTPAPAQGTLPAGVTCTRQPAPAAPANTPPPGDKERDGEGDGFQEAAAPAPSSSTSQPTVTCTGLTPPVQAPAPSQQMPQTRTGAS